jgi:hypothetical protein
VVVLRRAKDKGNRIVIIKVDLAALAWRTAILNAKDGDSFAPASPGTLLLDNPLPVLAAQGVSLYLDGLLFRMALSPAVYAAAKVRIAAMSALGFSGAYTDLDRTQQKAVTDAIAVAKIAGAPIDTGAVDAMVDAFLATLAPIRDSRLFDAKPIRTGQINYNGKPYTFDVHWQSKVGKGILTVKTGVWGTYVAGAIFENGRMEGESYNAAGIRTQGTDLFMERCTFRDCEAGWLGGRMGISNLAGDWFSEDPAAGKFDIYGFGIDVDCEYDNCGAAGGLAHGHYVNETLFDLSIRAHVVRSNGGHGLKFHGGLQLALEANIEDPADGTSAMEQAIDMTSGPGYVINCSIAKATSVNTGAPVMMRNGRDPIPGWFENAMIVRGNVITNSLLVSTSFVNVMNEAAFKNAYMGVPRPIRAVIDGNVLRGGAKIMNTPILAPADAFIGSNPIIGMNDPVVQTKVPLPNYDWSRTSWKSDLADVLAHVDPGRDWEAKLFASPTYPPGITVITPEEDPAVIAELQAQLKTAQDNLTTAQSALAQAQEALQSDADQIARLEAENAAMKAKIAAVVAIVAPPVAITADNAAGVVG